MACEACHGPGKDHIAWTKEIAKSGKASTTPPLNMGFAEQLTPTTTWRLNNNKPTMTSDSDEPNKLSGQLGVCARCHSRRAAMSDSQPGSAFDDVYDLQAIQLPLYHADGQIHDEVYVTGSFMQSKMFQSGVVCSNCHNPHSLELKLPGNQVCSQCHQSTVFDTPAHHHHINGSTGAECVNCHMPATTYMQIDPRRDHSLRVPRPDLSIANDTPNACNQCHLDKTPTWANEAIINWRGNNDQPSHFSDLLAPALNGANGMNEMMKIVDLVTDDSVPGIIQASSLAELAKYPNQQTIAIAQNKLHSKNPMERASAVRVFSLLPPEDRKSILLPLTKDKSRSVRHAVVQQLAGMNEASLTPDELNAWRNAKSEYESALDYQADFPEGQLNIGMYHLAQKNPAAAEKAYQQALKQDPYQLSAYINLADLYRGSSNDEAGWEILNTGIQKMPQAAPLFYSGGMLKVRQKNYSQAKSFLHKATLIAPTNAQYSYTYGLILQYLNNKQDAITEWERGLKISPEHQQILMALLNSYQDLNNWKQALRIANKLKVVIPDNKQLDTLIINLKAHVKDK
ncbi:Lipopolysaccharide assembly protein B [Zhongshania aliphaticivorans]|uniref:Lipopolysaccharide assembly protein B n=1 Tax=Zhongshania aliphaticivorans TaxID=1470434 RepID=A0A5S9QHI5_9GAMM|nr:Lipopolysaccharide assembly protein B [Zhongshania aliphaticivorans]CAA0118166.1 Lipopolysaccharide assembly protein B [Zhongshania aliphaticivorans]CAA0122173.1 Lipopolysaccharide assembly protein B [Zhongshania aliphaticivorans]